MKRLGKICLIAMCAIGLFAILGNQCSEALSKPSAPVIVRLQSAETMQEGVVKIKWSKVNCSGYEVKFDASNSFDSPSVYTVPGKRQSEKTFSKLQLGKKLYFSVRAYNGSGSQRIYSGWCSARGVIVHSHSYLSEFTDMPGCTTTGIETFVCRTCGKEYERDIPALKHKYAGSIIKAATYFKTGVKLFKCSRCGDSYTTTISKLVPETRNQKARVAAVQWAINIADDNSFHYGQSKWAHHSGCYYCGTNQGKSSLKIKAGATASAALKTYCCNPFVTAAYRHGAGAREVSCTIKDKQIGLANDTNKVFASGNNFSKIKKPSSVKSLYIGDILLTPTHCMIYAGDGKVVHAAHHDNGKKDSYWNDSIKISSISAKHWRETSKIYRYKGYGKY